MNDFDVDKFFADDAQKQRLIEHRDALKAQHQAADEEVAAASSKREALITRIQRLETLIRNFDSEQRDIPF